MSAVVTRKSGALSPALTALPSSVTGTPLHVCTPVRSRADSIAKTAPFVAPSTAHDGECRSLHFRSAGQELLRKGQRRALWRTVAYSRTHAGGPYHEPDRVASRSRRPHTI